MEKRKLGKNPRQMGSESTTLQEIVGLLVIFE